MRPSGPARAVLERELAKAQRLGPHKNLAAVMAVFGEGDQLLVAHEWPDGHTLRELIDAQRRQGRDRRAPSGPTPCWATWRPGWSTPTPSWSTAACTPGTSG